jgi:hypothetical protein
LQNGKGAVSIVNAAPLVGGGLITNISAAMKTIANFWPIRTDTVRLHLTGDAMAAANDPCQ